MAFDKPQSRNEAILQNMLGANNELEPPKSRVEVLLQDIAGQMPEANPSEGTTTGTLERLKIGDDIYTVEGGGSGTSDYDALNNKPQIAGTELKGNKSLADLGIASAQSVSNITNGESINNFAGVETALSNKQATLTFDDTPTQNSTNPVKSGGVYSALSAKEDAFTAGDYLKLTNGTLSVQKSKGDDVYDYKFITTSTADVQPSVKIQRYINGVFQNETNYINDNVRDHPVTLDDLLTFTYGIGGYYWQYTLLENSNQHNKDEVVRWYYTTSVDYEETFDVPQADTSKNLVLQEDLDAAISSAYHHAGTKTCAELVAGLLVAGNEGNVYNMTDSGTTTADFIEGAGQPIKAGDNVGIAKISDGVYKFDLLSGFVDTTNFVQKSETAGLLKNDGTVDTTIQGDVSSLKSGLINVNTINNQCSFDVNSIRATFNAQSKVVSFDVRSNDGFTASTWTALLTITDATLAPSVAMYFPVVFINANRDAVVGHGVGTLDTSNIISVCPDDTIPAYSEAVGLVMWQ